MKEGEHPDVNIPIYTVNIPIYTVHDNFITTPKFAKFMPYFYRQALLEMGHPLVFINKFVYDNIIAHALELGSDKFTPEQMQYLLQIKELYTHPRVWEKNYKPEGINETFLDLCFKIIAPQTLEEKELREWNNKIKDIKLSYNNYKQCFYEPSSFQNIEEIINALQRNIDEADYCIHC